MGVGKSTELAAAQQHLAGSRSRISRIAVDHTLDMRRVQAGAVCAHILAVLGVPHSDGALWEANLAGETREVRRDLARKELRAAGTAALFVDGLEKADEATARAVADELFGLGDDADIVLVVPASLAYGPGTVILDEDVRLFFVRPVRVWSPAGAPVDNEAIRGRLFLREVALRHLGRESLAPYGPDQVILRFVDQASIASGGVPRVVLQLLREVHRHATIAGRSWLEPDNLQQAIRDHGEQLRRSLLPGDVDALIKAEGQDGTEVPIERKLRFLLQGHLLEYKVVDRIVMHMAPTLAQALRFQQDFA
jgi:hypothetical protein